MTLPNGTVLADIDIPLTPSMNPESILFYIAYKMGAKGSILRVNDHIIRYILGRNVICKQDWKDPENATQFMAVIKILHYSKN